MNKKNYKNLTKTERINYHISISKKYDNFNDYISDNYLRDMERTKKYSFKFKLLNEFDIEDCYHNCIKKMIEIDQKNVSFIENYNGYFWITILNELKNTNKKIQKNINDKKKYIEQIDEDETIEMFDFSDKLNINFLDILEKNIKDKLNNIEYCIFKNRFFGNLNGVEISELLGYSTCTIYQKNKKINNIIKKEIYENRDLYYQ